MHDDPTPAGGDGIRLTDVLTTAAAVANYVAAPVVEPRHMLDAVDVLNGDRTMDDLGRPRSPLIHAHRGPAPVNPAVRDLVQRWYQDLGSDVQAELTGGDLERFCKDLREIPPVTDEQDPA